MRSAALVLVLTLGSCTIIGASAGAIAGDHNDQVGRDAAIGAAIGAGVDLIILTLYLVVQNNLHFPS